MLSAIAGETARTWRARRSISERPPGAATTSPRHPYGISRRVGHLVAAGDERHRAATQPAPRAAAPRCGRETNQLSTASACQASRALRTTPDGRRTSTSRTSTSGPARIRASRRANDVPPRWTTTHAASPGREVTVLTTVTARRPPWQTAPPRGERGQRHERPPLAQSGAPGREPVEHRHADDPPDGDRGKEHAESGQPRRRRTAPRTPRAATSSQRTRRRSAPVGDRHRTGLAGDHPPRRGEREHRDRGARARPTGPRAATGARHRSPRRRPRSPTPISEQRAARSASSGPGVRPDAWRCGRESATAVRVATYATTDGTATGDAVRERVDGERARAEDDGDDHVVDVAEAVCQHLGRAERAAAGVRRRPARTPSARSARRRPRRRASGPVRRRRRPAHDCPSPAATTGNANTADPNSSATRTHARGRSAIDGGLADERLGRDAPDRRAQPRRGARPCRRPRSRRRSRAARIARLTSRIRWSDRSATVSPGGHRSAASPMP